MEGKTSVFFSFKGHYKDFDCCPLQITSKFTEGDLNYENCFLVDDISRRGVQDNQGERRARRETRGRYKDCELVMSILVC